MYVHVLWEVGVPRGGGGGVGVGGCIFPFWDCSDVVGMEGDVVF